MDLVSVALLSLFAGAAAGGLLGFLVARVSRFEIGLSIGLLVFGAVALVAAARCFMEYRYFAHAGANAVWGEVIAIEDQPANASGSITSPVPVVRFTAPDNVEHTVRGPSASSATVGSHVNVVYDPANPQRPRIGQLSELRGGAIALLLFGTFPVSFGIWLLFTTALAARAERSMRQPDQRGRQRAGRATSNKSVAKSAPSPRRGRAHRVILGALNGALVCAILWTALAPGDLALNFVQGFAAIAAILAAYAAWGMVSGMAGGAWSAGMLVLAINFAVWAFALDLLR